MDRVGIFLPRYINEMYGWVELICKITLYIISIIDPTFDVQIKVSCL